MQTVSMEGVRLRLPSRGGDGDRVSLFPMDPFLRPLHPLSARRNAVVLPLTISWHRANEEEESNMQVSQHFENWDNFVNKCSVCLHAVMEKELSSGQTILNSRPWDTSRTSTSADS
jgi:hypothetical protein